MSKQDFQRMMTSLLQNRTASVSFLVSFQPSIAVVTAQLIEQNRFIVVTEWKTDEGKEAPAQTQACLERLIPGYHAVSTDVFSQIPLASPAVLN